MALPTSSNVGVFQFVDSGSVLRTVHCEISNATYKLSRSVNKYQTYCQVDKAVQPADISGTLDFEWQGPPTVVDPNDVDKIFHDLMFTTAPDTYRYGPAGSATGAVMYSGVCYFNDYEIKAKAGQILEGSSTFEVVGNDSRLAW